MQGSSISAVRIKRTAHPVPRGDVSADQRHCVVRDRIELSTFRFSGERPSPRESTAGRLNRPDDSFGYLGVQDRRQVSTTVVSTALATGSGFVARLRRVKPSAGERVIQDRTKADLGRCGAALWCRTFRVVRVSDHSSARCVCAVETSRLPCD
jgi:hypothetical protein